MIELDGGVVQVMQSVDNKHRNERACRACEGPRRRVNQPEGGDYGEVREEVIGEVVSNSPVDDLGQPPRERRQLIVAELPFSAVGERLDQVERKVGIEYRR